MSRDTLNNRNFFVTPEELGVEITITNPDGSEKTIIIPPKSSGEIPPDPDDPADTGVTWGPKKYIEPV